ncbi:hypothetical protein SLA2020_266950 [Shorea laevis]
MLPRLSPFLRPLHPLLLPSAATPWRVSSHAPPHRFGVSPSLKSSLSGRGFHALCRDDGRGLTPLGRVWASQQREYRKVRRRAVKSKEKELELNVSICIEEDLPDDPEVLSIAEMLRLNVPMAMKVAFDGLKDSRYKTRDTGISDVGGFESVDLSLLLCNDEFIRKLNKEWRDEDHATDVLSMSQHAPELKLPILMLGDIVISIETAARQAEERGHTLLDEIRILMVHGLLHLLGFDHEISEEAEAEMEKEEELLLKSLGWKGKGLIQSAYDAETNAYSHEEKTDVGLLKDRKKEGHLRFYKPKFNYIFCDMDGTLLNSKSQITSANARALKEAVSRGVKVVIATGKARPAVISILKAVDLAGKDGIVSEFSPGVFLQVYLFPFVTSSLVFCLSLVRLALILKLNLFNNGYISARLLVVASLVSTKLVAARPIKTSSSLAHLWRENQGSNDLEDLVQPLHPLLWQEIVRYGEFFRACYKAFDLDPTSKSAT